jgi:hypothetical protein
MWGIDIRTQQIASGRIVILGQVESNKLSQAGVTGTGKILKAPKNKRLRYPTAFAAATRHASAGRMGLRGKNLA